MSRLGGNSPSADTDKSNNLKGDPGKDGVVAVVVGGTNCTVDATDPTSPIVNVSDHTASGVASVVGGTNTTVDNTDPANPIINVTASSSPTTTKGDVIARGASVDERVAVGTDGQVMTADAASAAGVKWDDPAAGGGSATRAGAKIEQTTNVPFTGTGFQTLDFETEEYDDAGYADLGTNADRLTVPAGKTRVDVTFNIQYTNTITGTAAFRCQIELYNSSDALQQIVAGQGADIGYGDHFANCHAAGVTVATGDYFIVKTISTDSAVTSDKYDLSINDSRAAGEAGVAGSGGGADFSNLKPGDGFLLAGEIAAAPTSHGDGTVSPQTCTLDFIYFSETTTTVNELRCANDTASNGGTLYVGLHPITVRGEIGVQTFAGSITVGSVADTIWTETLGTPWVIPKGHYVLVTYNKSGTNLTNIIHSLTGNSTAAVFGKYLTGHGMWAVSTTFESEYKTARVLLSDYDTVPANLSNIDWNDEALWKVAPVLDSGDVGRATQVPIVMMRVASTT